MPCPGRSSGPSCKSGCGHWAIVQAYTEERQRQEAIADEMYDKERAMYLEEHPMITFKQWLKWSRRND